MTELKEKKWTFSLSLSLRHLLARPLVPLFSSLVVFGLVLFVLYTPILDRYGYWEDEIYTARDIGISHINDHKPEFSLSFTKLTYGNDSHPPLYFWILEKWASVFGFSERSGRGFSLLCLGFILIVVAFSSREWAPSHPYAPFLAPFLFAISSYSFSLAREARMYTLVLLWVSLSLLLFSRLIDSLARISHTGSLPQQQGGCENCRLLERVPRGVLMGLLLVNTLGLYTHYYFIFLYVAEIVWMGCLLLRHRFFARGLIALFLPALLFLPWIPQLMCQYSRRYSETLWILGPEKPELYFHSLVHQGSIALVQLLFGRVFEFWKVLTMLGLTLLLYGILKKNVDTGTRQVAFLFGLALTTYLLLLANDLYHGTLTVTHTKYLFVPGFSLLMGYLVLSLGSLAPVRWILIILFCSYNFSALSRNLATQPHPDWREISRQVERVAQNRPLVVADLDYRTCLKFYSSPQENFLVEDSLSAYPEDFWYLALYLPWSEKMQQRVRQLEGRFSEVERVKVDQACWLIHYRLR